MNNKLLAARFAVVIAISANLCSCAKSSSQTNDKISGVLSENFISKQNVEKEIIPNEPSDFKWREITLDEFPDDAGCIMITGYVGNRKDIVIPQAIADKPVVAIAPFAFCPYTEEEMTYCGAGGDSSLDPELKVLELAISDGKVPDLTTNDDIADINAYEYESNMIEYLNEHTPVTSFTSIMIPRTIEYLLPLSFGFCDSLESVEIYGNEGNEPLIIECDGSPFYANSKLKSFNFYLSDKYHGNKHFFDYCINLENVYLYPDDEGIVNLSCIDRTNDIKSIHIANGTTQITGLIDDGGEFDSDNPILNYTKHHNTIFESKVDIVYLPASLTDIGKHTLCTHLPSDLNNLFRQEIAELECTEYASTIIIAQEGSFAESYAKKHGIMYYHTDKEIDKKVLEKLQSEQSVKMKNALDREEELKNDDLFALYTLGKKYCYNNYPLFYDNKSNSFTGIYVVSTDKGKNYKIDKKIEEDSKLKYPSLEPFSEFISAKGTESFDDYNYFIVCDSGLCSYVVMEDKNTGDVRTYPENSIYKYNEEYISFKPGDYGYNDLYDICIEEIKSNDSNDSPVNSNTATVKANGGLNMRSGAGKDFSKVTLIPDGSTVEVVEESGEWSLVKYNSYTGWVKSSYLR